MENFNGSWSLGAPGWFGKAGHLTGSLARSRGEQLVDVLQIAPGDLGKRLMGTGS